MKKLTTVTSLILVMITLLTLLPAAVWMRELTAEVAEEATDDAIELREYDLASEPAAEVDELAYSGSGFKTYTQADIVKKRAIGTYSSGSYSCTGMQGMNVGTTYIYNAKIYTGSATTTEYQAIIRTNISTGDTVQMSYYSSTSATSTSACTSLGHANDLVVVTTDSVNYMYVATCNKTKALTRLKISGTKLYFTGYFNLVNSSGSEISASSVRCVKHSDGKLYFLIKNGMTFYTCVISDTAKGGSASSPTKVTCYKLFTIDTRNARFVSSSGSVKTIANLETWTNQGFNYSSSEKAIYVPLFDQYGTGYDNVILTFNIADYVSTDRLTQTKNTTTVVYPNKLAFRISDSSQSLFEIESCGFRTGQSSTGDLYLYFNTNASSSAKEGIYYVKYKRGSATLEPIFTPGTDTSFTVKYDGNGGAVPSDEVGNFKMKSTRHIYGVSTKLRPNHFERSGYTFAGWYLYRSSDKKWLYTKVDGGASWYTKGSQPEGARLALYANKQSVSKLSAVDGDTITCYAQWKHNSTGTKSFYIQYDANGGSGTMEETKVTYGTSTKIRANAFTRTGYVFGGWTAHRRSDDSWAYIASDDFSGSWVSSETINSSGVSGLFRKAYKNSCSVSKTTSVDCDTVTFYAIWIKSETSYLEYSETVAKGTAATFKGRVSVNGDIYQVIVQIQKSDGTVVGSKTYKVCSTAKTISLTDFDSGVNTSTLAEGSYKYVVKVTTMNTTSSIMTVTVINEAFTVA